MDGLCAPPENASVYLPALGRWPVHLLAQHAILIVVNEHYALKAQATRDRCLGSLNAAERSVCPYNIRHLWITTMRDKPVEISAIAHLAGTSPRRIISRLLVARNGLRSQID